MIRRLASMVGAALALVVSPAVAADPTEILPRPTVPRPLPNPRLEAVDPKAPKPAVVVAQAREQCFSLLVPMTGYVVARREAVVILLPGDTITEVAVAEGDAVKADQALVQVSRPPRAPPAPGAAPRTETVALAAPAAGTIVRSRAAVGLTGAPTATDPLFRIAIDGEVELQADVQSFHVPLLAPGQPARVTIDRDELAGKVRLIPVTIDPRTQLGKARIALGRDPRLKFATFARAVVDARRSCGVAVPRAAVGSRAGGRSVQVLDGNVVRTRAVAVGLGSDTHVEITEGLSIGDRVVASAGTSLRDGDEVTPVEAAATTYGER